MKFIEERLKNTNDKDYPEVPSMKNNRTITEDSLVSFWDNEYDEVWNEC
jgi:hypothetical protein